MEKKKRFIIDVIFFSLIALMIFGVCKFIVPIMVPFIIAFIIASVLQVPVRRICKNYENRKRIVAILCGIGFYVILFSVVAVAGVKIFNTVADFLVSVPSLYQEEVVPALGVLSDNLKALLADSDVITAEEIDSVFQEYTNNIGNYITDFSMNAIRVISGSIAGIPGFFVKLIITIVSSFFFLLDYDMVVTFFLKCVPKGKETSVQGLLVYGKNTIIIYAKSYSLLFLLTFVELSIGFTILGIPYAPIIGALVAIFDILPVLGTGGILLPWAVILFVLKNIPMAVGMVILYLVITIIRNTLEPRIVGKQIGLHPLATLISMYLGVALLGLIGLIAFPVTLAVLTNMNRNAPMDFFHGEKEA